MWNASHLRAAWDLSENRRNSFPAPDEAALRQIRAPLRVTVNLAPEDPRLMDLDRNILSKLERVLPAVEIAYTARSRSGLFEGDHYGEVWYELSGRRVMSRSTTEPIVLDTIYKLAALPPPAPSPTADYAGHPLTASPRAAAPVYYAAWPILILLCAVRSQMATYFTIART